MIDFPSSPSTGQIFTAAGASWRWDGTKWVAYGGGSSGDVGRNLLHNPLFNVAQRGAGPFTVGFGVDRWGVSSQGGDASSVTQSILSDADRAAIGDEAARRSLTNVVTASAAAGAYTYILQSIEDVYRLSGKTVTVSFWARANSGTPKIGLNAFISYGTGGSPSASIWALSTGNAVTISTTWTRYSSTITIPTASGKTVGTNSDNYTQIALWYSAGSNTSALAGNIGVQSGTISLWGAQLEIGPQATPLEKPDPQQDLARCQRFYQIGIAWAQYSNGIAGNLIGNSYPFPVTMRTTPTVVSTGNSSTNVGTLTLNALGPSMVGVYGTITANGAVNIYTNFAASADL